MNNYNYMAAKILYPNTDNIRLVGNEVTVNDNIFDLQDSDTLLISLKKVNTDILIRDGKYLVTIDGVTEENSRLYIAFAMALGKSRLSYINYLKYLGYESKDVFINLTLAKAIAGLLHINLKDDTCYKFKYLSKEQQKAVGSQELLDDIKFFSTLAAK